MQANVLDTNVALLFGLLAISLISCGIPNPTKRHTFPVDHKIFDELLMKHVDERGRVDYAGFLSDSSKLESYLGQIKNNPPNPENWSQNDQLAYWINAYNAFTIQLILDNYPVESIKDIGAKIQIPFVNTPWDIKFIKIGGEKYDLNNIEHNILRKNFNEPRVHFAIVCASYSCPQLRQEAYVGGELDSQLTDQTKNFLNDYSKNQISEDEIEISKIFSWFKGDFTKEGSLIEFLNQYSTIRIAPKASIRHLDYDWSLNGQ